MTHSSFRSRSRFTPNAGCFKTPALVPARARATQKDTSPCSAALDCPAQPCHGAPLPPQTLSTPTHEDADVEFSKGCPPHLPSTLAGIDLRTLISSINCSAEYTALLPQVPADPEAHSMLGPSLQHTCTPSAPKSPRPLELEQN